MPRPRVYVARRLPEVALERLRAAADVAVWETDEVPPPREVLLRQAAGADGLISLLTDPIDGALLDAAPRLRVVSNYAVGFDNIDVAAATARGVVVTNTPGVLTETVADFAMALMLATARRLVEADRYTRAGQWKSWMPMLLLGPDVHHATLGLVGLGRIGAAVARRARGFAMTVLYHDVVRREDLEAELGLGYVPLEDLLRRADFVSIHTPLLPETRHLIGAAQFALMKPTAILINTARGPIVDQRALYEALRTGRIAGAGLDVFEIEPVAADEPLLRLDNVVVAPHIASASVETRTQMALMAVDNLLAALDGRRPPNLVNPEVWDRRRT
ncbi:MAG: D-glycerate dehydrogenase [Armatimonadota bacterium]|nr:D-glycerate dehydrogenase [Armatimonadota bacterium]MDR7421964.1 D-glycerate dehydrogenase [Armatimonadota bacterium]MDR7453500.1 D-glycerate dehydrogenase [Armatimonadota bacterium]MDR7456965.1 D-glycerate dehydrogenase [Armatimonadota bacterium]MDR7496488.1 D-glycerate dehydrogenase [Armatimonadota bacterium]